MGVRLATSQKHGPRWATTHQGGGVVGKRLQTRLLSDALTGGWQNRDAGEGQGSEPRETEVCHEGPFTRSQWGGYHLAQPRGPPGPKGL